jgi:ABC-type lipoprotein release transport system permease subunit
MQYLLWQDLRSGARMLLKKRAFMSSAIIAMALGIGANTTVFSLVNAALRSLLTDARASACGNVAHVRIPQYYATQYCG